MKYIKLPNGNTMEFFSYAVTNSCIIKFLNKSFEDIKEFFGTSTIKCIEIVNEDGEIEEQKELGGMKRTTTYTESGTINEVEQKLVSDEYDEVISVVTGQDEDGNDITEEQTVHHEAVYENVIKKIPVEFMVAVLERPTFEEQISEVKDFVGVIDPSALDLDGWKDYKQEENKSKLAEFLANSYVEFNGKQYGVEEEDQTEMALNYMQYQISKQAGLTTVLEWHAKKEKCVSFTEEDFLTLSVLVKSFVYPYMNQMQEYKEQIYACNSIADVQAIIINYVSPSQEEV